MPRSIRTALGVLLGLALGFTCIWLGWQLAVLAHSDAISTANHRYERALVRAGVGA